MIGGGDIGLEGRNGGGDMGDEMGDKRGREQGGWLRAVGVRVDGWGDGGGDGGFVWKSLCFTD